MKPIEPGCLAWFHGAKRRRTVRKGQFVEPQQTLVQQGPLSTDGGLCPRCGRSDNAWWCPDLPDGARFACGCMLTRINGYDESTKDSEPAPAELERV